MGLIHTLHAVPAQMTDGQHQHVPIQIPGIGRRRRAGLDGILPLAPCPVVEPQALLVQHYHIGLAVAHCYRHRLLESKARQLFSVPATRIAEELGRKMVANIVMLGFLAAVTNVVHYESLQKAVLSSVPKGTEELNTTAFEKGYRYGEESRGRQHPHNE